MNITLALGTTDAKAVPGKISLVFLFNRHKSHKETKKSAKLSFRKGRDAAVIFVAYTHSKEERAFLTPFLLYSFPVLCPVFLSSKISV